MQFTCPRCHRDAEARFYGPCDGCREELGSLGGEARDVEAVTYEPKMNVTPNQVATKE